MQYLPYSNYKHAGVDWLREIPTHWQILRVKFAAPIQNERSEERSDELPYIALEHIESGSGRLLEVSTTAKVESVVSLFRRDDILFNKLRPYLAKVVHAPIDGSCSSELLVLRPGSQVMPRFLLYYLLSDSVIKAVDSYTYGAKMPRASADQIADLPLLVPPMEEQRVIANYLDRQTAVLDDLIREKQALIQLLQEKRTALISRAVTQGLDPHVPMKESGVSWIGRVPAHWRIIRLRYVVQNFVDYRGRTPEKVPHGIPLVTARNIINGKIDFSLSEEFIREEDYESWMVRGFPEIGDVLITTEAPLGDAAQVVDTNIALAQRIVLLKVYHDRIKNEYLKNYILSSAGQGELWSRATGSTALGIKASWLKTISVLVPPLREQKAMVAYIDEEAAQVDKLIAEIEAGIATLQEYRAALIAAAVTGQIDVRNNRGR